MKLAMLAVNPGLVILCYSLNFAEACFKHIQKVGKAGPATKSIPWGKPRLPDNGEYGRFVPNNNGDTFDNFGKPLRDPVGDNKIKYDNILNPDLPDFLQNVDFDNVNENVGRDTLEPPQTTAHPFPESPTGLIVLLTFGVCFIALFIGFIIYKCKWKLEKSRRVANAERGGKYEGVGNRTGSKADCGSSPGVLVEKE